MTLFLRYIAQFLVKLRIIDGISRFSFYENAPVQDAVVGCFELVSIRQVVVFVGNCLVWK